MPSTTTIRVLLFFALVCLPSIVSAQEKPVGLSTISGRVVFADTGRPVRRATLKLYTDLKLNAVRTTAANLRGEFRFSEVAAGTYFVVAEFPGALFPRSSYVANEFGIGSDTEMESAKVAVDGKNSMRCEVRVFRAGTIRGTITYADGEPAVNGRIALFRRKDGVVVPYFGETVMTNDRGMYRIDGLPAGEYFVGVVVGKVSASSGRRIEDGNIPTAYYPGVANISEAKVIQIESGSDVAGVSITFDDHPLRQISGVVKWRRDGTTVNNASLFLRRKDEPAFNLSLWTLYESMGRESEDEAGSFVKDVGLLSNSFPPFFDTDKTGEWKFIDLPPGTYLITAFAERPKEKRSAIGDGAAGDSPGSDNDSRHVAFQQTEITIADEDQKNITIELPEGNRILGTVTVEESEKVKVSILVDQKGANELLMSVPNFSRDDGTFILPGIPSGEVILDADVSGFRDFYLKSITLSGQDLLREPLVVTPDSEITGVSINIGKGLATLSGRVQFKEDGSPSAGGGVLLVKADPKLWHLRSSKRFAMTNAAGEFKVSCAPGDYLVFTWPAGAQPWQTIEQFVRMNVSTARTVSLQSKEEKQIELTLSRPRK